MTYLMGGQKKIVNNQAQRTLKLDHEWLIREQLLLAADIKALISSDSGAKSRMSTVILINRV